jgi:hypothetical protein
MVIIASSLVLYLEILLVYIGRIGVFRRLISTRKTYNLWVTGIMILPFESNHDFGKMFIHFIIWIREY